MAKIYYGSGNCSVEGSDIKGIEITYNGRLQTISDNTPDGFVLMNSDNKILIFPLPNKETGSLNNLFDYAGKIKIFSAISVNSKLQKESLLIKPIMDYVDMINTNVDELTLTIDKMDQGYYSNKKIEPKTKQKILTNLDTNIEGTRMYLKDGSEYTGLFHMHLDTFKVMTGANHTEESQELNYKKRDLTKKIRGR